MKFNMEAAPRTVSEDDVQVGNIYRTQKKLYVIISIIEKDSACGNNAVAFSINLDGSIENAVSYSTFYFSRQKLVGKAVNLPEIIDVDWF